MKIYRKYIKSEGVEVRPQICFYELFIYDFIMGKFFWSITPLPSLDILIYKKYIGKYISIYREKGQFLHHQIFSGDVETVPFIFRYIFLIYR